ncbi:methyltransferase [Kitasatospora sp. NPDC059827]|uniref:methyltransferase n=1 Tax=Kitasatospora sp. NPDC059827 TaxID=3346964 RepID=UPI003649A992
MLGVIRQHNPGDRTAAVHSEEHYEVYFGLGHSLRLQDRQGVFKVSPAGLSLGDVLVRTLDRSVLGGSVLDMGTGSGALALLMRSLGARDIVATDVSIPALKTAAENEQLNFGDRIVRYDAGSLFQSPAADRRFDLVVFNPPGWRTPSADCRRELRQQGLADLELSAMFSGEEVLLGFLRELPHHLTDTGRAVIGLNSMTGIQDVLRRLGGPAGSAGPLEFRLIERHSFPLFLYTREWHASRQVLTREFHHWKEHHGAAFSIAGDGTLYWSYEIVECRLARRGERRADG